jgi:MYXO-CTERM domain-containing protein
MNLRCFVATLSWVVPFTLARPATADLAPAPEPCTRDQKQTSTSECLECIPDGQPTDRCATLLAPYCFTQVCVRGGAPNVAVWCRTKSADAPVVPLATLNQLELTNPYPVDAGGATAPSTCPSYTPPSAPAPATAHENDGGCSTLQKGTGTNALLWGLLALGGLTMVRRRARRDRT